MSTPGELPPIRRGPSPGVFGTLLERAGVLGSRDEDAERAFRQDLPDAIVWIGECPACIWHGRQSEAFYIRYPVQFPEGDGLFVCHSRCMSDDWQDQLLAALAQAFGETPASARAWAERELERTTPPRIDASLGPSEIACAAQAALGRVPEFRLDGGKLLLEGRSLTRPEFGVLLSEVVDVRRGGRRIAIPAPAVTLVIGSLMKVGDGGAATRAGDDVERAIKLLGDALVDCTSALGHAPTAPELINHQSARVAEALGLLGRPATPRALGYSLRGRFETGRHTVSGVTWLLPKR
jgi:hypothetical protein